MTQLLIFISVAKLYHQAQIFVLLGTMKIHSKTCPCSNNFTLVTDYRAMGLIS